MLIEMIRQDSRTEAEFVEDFVASLTTSQAPWPLGRHVREFGYSGGRTDIVAASIQGQLIAFEAKLTRWRDALCQAYRNRAFAHLSYVVMPEVAAYKAAAYQCEYERYGVGLCTLENNEIVILITADESAPVLGWLADKAHNRLAIENESTDGSSQGDLRFPWGLAD